VRFPGQQSGWARLLRIARALIRQVNSDQSIIDHWTLGGGTAMMLQIDHRESRDVDIFLSDPQLLSYLDPQKRDFEFEIPPTGYDGDGATFQKLAFKDVGEIDFIVGRAMTQSPTIQTSIEGETTLLETIPEIIAKKIYYRGSSIRPRDIFDIAAASEQHADSIIVALRSYRTEVWAALGVIEKLNPDFVNSAIAQLAIKDKFRSVANTAFERASELLRAA
jgi:nucleotidyltransferase AbiEii toxin of type IV toxin-antitoxin system